METYRVEVKIGEDIKLEEIEQSEDVLQKDLSLLLSAYDIKVQHIISDAVEYGTSACWCGSQNFGYKIAKHTDDDKHIKYVFG